MIILKNSFKEADFNEHIEEQDHYEFRVKDSVFTINKKNKLFNKIHSYYMEKVSNQINCTELTEEKARSTKEECMHTSKNNVDYDLYSESSESDDHLSNKTNDTNKYGVFMDPYDKKYQPISLIFKSNFDNKSIEEDNEYDKCPFNFHNKMSDYFAIEIYSDSDISDDDDSNENDLNSNECNFKRLKKYGLNDDTSNYYENVMFDINNMTFRLNERSEVALDDIAQKQFQLLLDGYDIIITDFIADRLLIYAQMFDIQELIQAIEQLQNQMANLKEYDRFSELEILQTIEDTLDTINEENFIDKSSIILSLYVYTGSNLFEYILIEFKRSQSEKKSLYLKIANTIKSRYDFKKMYELEKDDSYSSDTKITNSNLMPIILNDDDTSLQNIISYNPKFDIEKEFIDLKKHDPSICLRSL